MLRIKITLIIVMLPLFVIGQKGYKLNFKGRWDNDSLVHIGSQTYNSLWGWTSPKGKEYAIIGSLDSIYFIEVTDGTPIVRDAEAGKYNRCIHREFKTYSHYCYAVADEGVSTLQIFDLQYLPDSVHKVYDTDTLCARAHNLWVDHDRLYIAINKRNRYRPGQPVITDVYPMTIASLSNPEVPVIIGNLQPPFVNGSYLFEYVHDMYVRNDTAYCSCEGYGVFIYDYANASSPKLIQSITPPYPDNGYNHSNYLSPDGNYLVFTDENHGAAAKIYDVSQLKTHKTSPPLNFVNTFSVHKNLGSVPHNSFIINNLAFLSYYQDGVVVFDISDPENSVRPVAAYDTYPQNDTISDPAKKYSGFEGCWNIYPFFPSGNVIASDMTNGLYVLHLDTTVGVNNQDNDLSALILGNGSERPILSMNSANSGIVALSICDASGKLITFDNYPVVKGQNTIDIPTSGSGFYFLSISTENAVKTFKLFRP